MNAHTPPLLTSLGWFMYLFISIYLTLAQKTKVHIIKSMTN